MAWMVRRCGVRWVGVTGALPFQRQIFTTRLLIPSSQTLSQDPLSIETKSFKRCRASACQRCFGTKATFSVGCFRFRSHLERKDGLQRPAGRGLAAPAQADALQNGGKRRHTDPGSDQHHRIVIHHVLRPGPESGLRSVVRKWLDSGRRRHNRGSGRHLRTAAKGVTPILAPTSITVS